MKKIFNGNIKELDISIAFKDDAGYPIEKPYIAYVYLLDGVVYFSVYNFNKERLHRFERVNFPIRPSE